jgi:hypothetical protein
MAVTILILALSVSIAVCAVALLLDRPAGADGGVFDA